MHLCGKWLIIKNIWTHWCRRRGAGGASAPQKFFGENPSKSFKTSGNLGKFSENLHKITGGLRKHMKM